LTSEEATEIVCSFGELGCWKVGLAYGSTIYLELGDRVRAQDGDTSREVGVANLWLYGDDWRVESGDGIVTDSGSVDRDIVESFLSNALQGCHIERLESGPGKCRVALSKGMSIRLWRFGDADADSEDDDLLNLFLPDRRIICFSVSRGFYFSHKDDEASAGE